MFENFKELTKEQLISIYGGAQEVGDIDRTQPNKLRKQLF